MHREGTAGAAGPLARARTTYREETTLGFLQLVPASELKAVYVATPPDSGKLVLTARGEAQKFTSGIAFQADAGERGELRFSLMGWVGPLAQGKTAYERTQSFEELRFPGARILVETANHPSGIQVPVDVVPIEAAPMAAAAAVQPADSVTVMHTHTFDVQNPARVNTGGSISMDFDSSMLALQNAGITSPSTTAEIDWTFKALKIGETQVKITTRGGLVPIIWQRVVQVKITPDQASG
jgi:hypothetical protein